MHLKQNGVITSALTALSATAALAATTPYDLIRPTWPLSWDTTVFEHFDTTVTKKIGVLDIPNTPASFKAGELILDTLDQAYLDAINFHMSPIRINQVGYLENDPEKQFYYIGNETKFEVVDANGKSFKTKLTGTLTASGVMTTSDWSIIAGSGAYTSDQKRYQVDIPGQSGKIMVGNIPESVPTNERLRIKIGDHISSTFIVSEDVYTMAKDATLKFFGIQRSGNSESWFHGPSHVTDGGGPVVEGSIDSRGSFNKSAAGSLAGGWYDCGDHLKESQTQAFAFMTLAVMSATNHSKDVDHYDYNHAEFVKTDNVPDVLREAKHGADFFLRAYNFANGVIDDMPVSVGNFGSDHGFWSRPEVQDYLPVDKSAAAADRGGPAARTVRLGELGSNISGMIVTGLAILGKDYAKYDKDFADSCLTVAEKMYDFAKALAQGKDSYDDGKPFVHNTKAAGWSSPAYNGNNEFYDDMALASVALLYATGKEEYADDMIRTKNLVQGQEYMDCAGCFEGGWFVTNDKGFLKNVKNTSWANSYAYATYALYKLILADKTKATTEYGLTETEWLSAVEDCIANMIYNLGDMSNYGGGSVSLPKGGLGWKQNTVSYDPTWYSMQTDQSWIYNRYQAGNIFEVLAYADVAADIQKQGISLPIMGSPNWKADEMLQLGINQLNYIFGVNPWDISFVYGVGDKNDAHPHHRAANPEGRNAPAFDYKYACPVGGLLGSLTPGLTNSWVPDNKSWEDYHLSETCLDASAILLSALTIVSNGGNDYYEKKCDNCSTDDATPFAKGDAYATAYHYEWNDMDAYSIGVLNASLDALDSIEAYLYFDATEKEIESGDIALGLELCNKYDIASFSHPCDNYDELIDFLHNGKPEKVEGTYNKKKKTYTWEQAIPLPPLDAGEYLRIDLLAITRIGEHDTVYTPAKVKIDNAWSFTSHTASKSAPSYEGAPDWPKDQGELQSAPRDPYIVVHSKGKLLWGYGPSNTTDDRVSIVNVANVAQARMQLNKNKLHVLASAQGTKTVKIFDLLGNQLTTQTFDGTRTEVDLAKFPHRGALIARVMQNGKVLATQNIKVK